MSPETQQKTARPTTEFSQDMASLLIEAIDEVPLVRQIKFEESKILIKSLGLIAAREINEDKLPTSIHERVPVMVRATKTALRNAGQRVGPLRTHKIKKVFYG